MPAEGKEHLSGPDRKRKEAVVLSFDLFKCRQAIYELNTTISNYSVSDRFYEEYELALCEYFESRQIDPGDSDAEVSEDFFQDEDEFSRFMSWFCTYFINNEYGKTFPECYLSSRIQHLTDLEREILEAYGRSCLCLYEVQWTRPGRGLELKSVFSGESFFVHDDYFADLLCKWDLVYAGLICVRGFFFLAGFEPIIIPPRLKNSIEEEIDVLYRETAREAGQGTPAIEVFLRQKSMEVFTIVDSAVRDFHRKANLKNADGDLLFYVTVHYRIQKRSEFFEKIELSNHFVLDRMEKDPEGEVKAADYLWIRKERLHAKRPVSAAMGILLVEGEHLKGKCNSGERAEKLKRILAESFGDSIELKMTLHEKPQEQLFDPDDPITAEPEPEKQENSPEEAALLKEISSRHYRNWVDEKIPALGDLTPREAMQTPDGRKKLIDLIKELENQNERAVRKGLRNADILAFPADKIREELGL